ncbi:MAG TPA: hypothetical protein VMV53_10175 [Acidimicrobiales bacterium]|nr:hypothetical protein [Acidimicrobiales bacterium]
MRLPIDTTKVTVLAIGQPRPVLDFGTENPKIGLDGKPVFKIPVLLMGTGDRTDPTATITVTGDLTQVTSGLTLRCKNLTVSTWSLRDNNGRERSGITLRADSVDVEAKTSR